MEQGALGAAGVMRVWAGAGLQRAAYRGGAYCAASRTACYINCERREGVEGEGMGGVTIHLLNEAELTMGHGSNWSTNLGGTRG